MNDMSIDDLKVELKVHQEVVEDMENRCKRLINEKERYISEFDAKITVVDEIMREHEMSVRGCKSAIERKEMEAEHDRLITKPVNCRMFDEEPFEEALDEHLEEFPMNVTVTPYKPYKADEPFVDESINSKSFEEDIAELTKALHTPKIRKPKTMDLDFEIDELDEPIAEVKERKVRPKRKKNI